jgi:hypothetical protein
VKSDPTDRAKQDRTDRSPKSEAKPERRESAGRVVLLSLAPDVPSKSKPANSAKLKATPAKTSKPVKSATPARTKRAAEKSAARPKTVVPAKKKPQSSKPRPR